ncbi:MAG TPA: hypothetical protein VGO80_06130 [Solirubrobacteraceae bacterium]|jgi:hypothetical protein|nr:hypothetical protein [Solirubrobacteraceae bacterium]
MLPSGLGGPKVGGGALMRYREPRKPPTVNGASARQAGELERLRARYGRLEYSANADGTLTVVVYGDGHGESTVSALMRPDGSLDVRSGSFRPRNASTAAGTDED